MFKPSTAFQSTELIYINVNAPGDLATIFQKGDKLCDLLFVFLDTNFLLKKKIYTIGKELAPLEAIFYLIE